MNDELDQVDLALGAIRSLWPQTATWEPATWAAWGEMLADLPAETLFAAIRQVAVSETWPSLAAIRRAALAGMLAAPAEAAYAVACQWLYDLQQARWDTFNRVHVPEPPELVRAAVDAAGVTEDWVTTREGRRSFIACYRDVAERHDTAVLTGAGLPALEA